MAIDTQDKLDKALASIKAYEEAVLKKNKYEKEVQDKLVVMKNATGANNVDEALVMIGRIQINGLPENR